jgi:hypothetical protein
MDSKPKKKAARPRNKPPAASPPTGHYASGIPPSPEPGTLPLPRIPPRVPSPQIVLDDAGTNPVVQAAMRAADRRGGSLLQLPTGAPPLWACHKQHRFSLTADAVVGGVWCEDCVESLGETAVRRWLDRSGLDYSCEAMYPTLVSRGQLRLDFCVPGLRWGIEVDGEQHLHGASFKGTLLSRLENDEAKDAWAERERFSIQHIPYWRMAETEALLDAFRARLEAGEGPVIDCPYRQWRVESIGRLRQKKRPKPPPVPVDAKERVKAARDARKEEATLEKELACARAPAPAELSMLM